MTLNLVRVRHYLNEFRWDKLFFEEMGWDHSSGELSVTVAKEDYTLRSLAQKRGVQIFECQPDAAGKVPEYDVRRKIEKAVAKSAHEHLIIFIDAAKSTQIWQWVARQPGQPIAYREYPFCPATQSGDSVIQKLELISFPLSAEEGLALTGVVFALRDAFDRDKVTKKFYDQFKKEHADFLKFIKGIPIDAYREWYASLMLNRLMFIYFIQEKGFLDGDTRYLQNRLKMVLQRKGKDKFLSFYRYFLLRLFHEGLGQQTAQRSADFESILGQVPYLNGGLFEVHELEQTYSGIDIPDDAFHRLFAFFDGWRWHLDERPLKNDREINPDVLGYIFEKYINQKQMGAYYTKEDITGYIAKNTVIPHLFDATEKKCAIAFQPGSALWRLLRDDPDRYIYSAMRKGLIDEQGEVIPLPRDIGRGLEDVGQRGGWNRPAETEFALPTETWREHVARRERCLEIREKVATGEIHQINDLITYNLDIRQFAQDVITTCEGPELLRAFYNTLAGRVPEKSNEQFEPGISVLDPTCGSGAFLFAALNILEPLYEACLTRMRAFVDDMDNSGEPHSPQKYADFRRILADLEKHPNARYFILKSIVVNNLYGVDIMEEAVEICKLRLFLKLVAQVDKVKELEPLPDIDFNIRAGNTLVGFATLDDVKRTLEGTLADKELRGKVDRIEEDAEVIERAFERFHEMQTGLGIDAQEFGAAKRTLRDRLKELAAKLDGFLAEEYAVDVRDKKAYDKWINYHEPFHWFAEFYGIISQGGFDVVIGNPPWKEYASVKRTYTVSGYFTERCGNLHGICTERALRLRSGMGRMSFIVQLPLTSSSRMNSVRSLLRQRSSSLFVVPFDDRPGKLFDGLEHCRSTIFFSEAPSSKGTTLYTARYQRWPTEARPNLFAQLEFARHSGEAILPGLFPKYASDLEVSIFAKVKARSDTTFGESLSPKATRHFVFYQEATQYWVKAAYGLPFYSKNGDVGAPAHGRHLYFGTAESAYGGLALLNSSLFYAYFIAHGDCFHLSDNLVWSFPTPRKLMSDQQLTCLGKRLQTSLTSNAARKTIRTRAGDEITYAEFFAARSKDIIDEIDCLLAKHYGFSKQEVDFIINYDFDFRMNLSEEVDEDE